MILLVALVLVGAVTTTMAWQMTTGYRLLEHRDRELQATWLARAGAEIAVARLLSNPQNYKGESLEIIPHGEVHIKVEPQANSVNEFRLEVDARYPTDTSLPVQSSISRSLQRVTDHDTITIKVQNPEK
jgi:hypothetical protein